MNFTRQSKNMKNDVIRTLAKRGGSIYEEKKSSFIGAASPVADEQEALDFIKSIRSEYKKARHYVFAYRICDKDANFVCRYSDDGEPQGTGGVPVLGVLEGGDIQNAVIVVVRYFGGILLGASGLTRAYRKAAAGACADAGTVLKVTYDDMYITVDYQSYNAVKRLISSGFPEAQNGGGIKFRLADEDFGDRIVIHILAASDDSEYITRAVTEASLGRAEIHTDCRKGRFDI